MDSLLSNNENIAAIIRIIRRAVEAQRFALIFANCGSLNEQKAYIQQLEQQCSVKDITLITIELWDKGVVKNLRSFIENHLQQLFPNNDLPHNLAIQVSGLELSIILDPDERFPTVLQTLNIGRERFYDDVPHPLLLWLPEYAYIKLANIAPDFWSVRDGSFFFLPHKRLEQQSLFDEVLSTQQDFVAWWEKASQIPLIERALEAESERLAPETLITLKLALGNAYLSIRRIGKAKNAYEKALEFSQIMKNPDWEAMALNGLGLVYIELNRFFLAIELFEKCLILRRQQGKLDSQALEYNCLGITYYRQGSYKQAIESYQQALEINRQIGNREAEGDVLGNLGLAYQKLKQFTNAIHAHHKALQISRELEDSQSELRDLGNIGVLYHKFGSYGQAINSYTQALQIGQQIGNKHDEYAQYLNLGDAWRDGSKLEEAQSCYIKAYEVAKEIGSEQSTLEGLERILETVYRTEEQKQKSYWLEKFFQQISQSVNSEHQAWGITKLLELCQQREIYHEKCIWLRMIEELIQKHWNQSGQVPQNISYFNSLITIYEELGQKERAEKYRQKFGELPETKWLNIWLLPGEAAIMANRPILTIQKPCTFWVSIGSPLTNMVAWKFSKEIKAIVREVHSGERQEGFKVHHMRESLKPGFQESSSSIPLPSPQENTSKNSSKLFKQELPVISIESNKREPNPEIGAGPELPQISEPIKELCLIFSSRQNCVSFDKSEIKFPFNREGSSRNVSLIVTPNNSGIHQVVVSLFADDDTFLKSLRIPLEVKRRLNAHQNVAETSSLKRSVGFTTENIGAQNPDGISQTKRRLFSFRRFSFVIESNPTKNAEHILIIRLNGSLYADSAPEMEKIVHDLINEGKYKIIVDFRQLSYISSSGLGVFMSVIGDVKNHNGDIVIMDMPPDIYHTFDLLGFTEIFTIVDDIQSALEVFKKSALRSLF